MVASLIHALRRPLRLTSVTLSLKDTKMLGRLSTRCLEVTSAPNTSRELPMGFGWRHFLYPQKRVTQTSKRDHFSKRVNMFNCHSCVFCACTSVYMTVNTRALCYLNQLYLKFWLVWRL
jgi:hypothetical protein